MEPTLVELPYTPGQPSVETALGLVFGAIPPCSEHVVSLRVATYAPARTGGDRGSNVDSLHALLHEQQAPDAITLQFEREGTRRQALEFVGKRYSIELMAISHRPDEGGGRFPTYIFHLEES